MLSIKLFVTVSLAFKVIVESYTEFYEFEKMMLSEFKYILA